MKTALHPISIFCVDTDITSGSTADVKLRREVQDSLDEVMQADNKFDGIIRIN
jgi:hypothetical protein